MTSPCSFLWFILLLMSHKLSKSLTTSIYCHHHFLMLDVILSFAVDGLFNDTVELCSGRTILHSFTKDYCCRRFGLCAKTEKLVNDILDFAEARKVRRNIVDTQWHSYRVKLLHYVQTIGHQLHQVKCQKRT